MTIDERIAAELRRQAPQVDEPAAWDRIRSAVPARRRGRALRLVSVSVAAFGFVLLGFVLLPNLSSGPPPASDPQSPFVGTWVSTDADGSTQTATFEVSIVGVVEMVVLDDNASVCSGVPSTMTGTGRLEGINTMIVPSPVLICDDGSEPQALSGPPLEGQLRNLTFALDPQAGTLTDSFGSEWTQEGAEDPRPEPTVQDSMWPQSSLEEVREAQELADAGDPDFTWQLEPALEENLDNGDYLGDPEIFARFLREDLGWEEFSRVVGAVYGDGTIGVTYIRCAVGESNSLYPDDLRVGRCAPTIDELRYEAVTITVVQPGQRGPSGIWVVGGWAMVEPVEQVVPPTNAEATAIVEAFLQARIDGRGAEQYFGGGDGGAPLLYATSAGATYERFEFALTRAPSWPSGEMHFHVRLLAENGQTVVEQTFMLERDGTGRWGLEALPETTEDGRSLPQFYQFLDGEVSFYAAPPWDYSWAGWEFSPTMSTLLLAADIEERLVVLADPQPIETACVKGQAPATAEALARSLGSDPDLEATEPVAVRMAGIDALQVDVTAVTSGNLCAELGVPEVVAGGTATGLDPGQRMRLYLIDYPGMSARVLAIAIIAPEDRFEQVLGAATPIVDSFDFYTG
jgi:hypothetical protein